MKLSLLFVASLAAASCMVACSASKPAEECGETSSQALSVCAKGAVIKGVDVSVYQGTVNWADVKSAGMVYAFVRVSDGATTNDTTFATNWPGAKNAGLIRGAYQYFRASQDPTTQANYFVTKMQAAGGMVAGDLPAVLDIETADGEPNATVVSRALTWLQVIEQKTGITPFVYTAEFMSTVIGTSLAKYPLWVANYGATCPAMPSGWTAWQFWQFSSTSTVSGISGNVDEDEFQGDVATLQKLTIQTTDPKPDAGAESDAGASDEDAGAVGGDKGIDAGDQGGTMGSAGQPASQATSNPDPSTATSIPCGN